MLPCLALSINLAPPSQLCHPPFPLFPFPLVYHTLPEGSHFRLMAFFTTRRASATLVLILCMVAFHEVSDCTSGNGYLYVNAAHSLSRKELASFKEKEMLQGSLHGSTSTGNPENFVDWELRTVPSGPDPLHHNGGSPKKPRTP